MKRQLCSLTLLLSFILNAGSIQEYIEQASHAIREKNGDKAVELLHKAYAIQPENPQISSQLASLYYLLGNYQQATNYFEQLSRIQSQPTVLFNLASAYSKQGLFTQAIPLLENVAAQSPPQVHVQTMLLKLYLRNMQWKKAEQILQPSLWWFDQNIYGKSILLDCDKEGNGLGDSIQFIRYAKYLKQAGAHVIVKVQRPLVDLFKLCPFIDEVITRESPEPFFNQSYSICIASLMCKMKDFVLMDIKEHAYLHANPYLIDLWKRQLESNPNFKIGLCWQSNLVRNSFTGQITPSPRAVPLHALKPLAQDGVTFYSLQKNADLTNAPFEIIQFQNDFDESHGRFMDTAALIMNCDLIITVDTSIAHLAGALGKPTWLLLNCESDYRWFNSQDFSYWYPHMKLFRQHNYGNWDSIIKTAAKQMHSYAQGNR